MSSAVALVQGVPDKTVPEYVARAAELNVASNEFRARYQQVFPEAFLQRLETLEVKPEVERSEVTR